ncbi:hypothetical protein [Pseudoduganella namucuonensis]|uniref:hypothetical protein n=1 Tax=Pseudoduganella namucuonensis TaxID=1035707 RepID=UPI00116042E2|nr:hypothetical protein [Pseudoduganella namucuonensis]
MTPTAFHQLGQFIVNFQHLEDGVNTLLVYMADANDEIVRILINELEFGKRLTTADVAFACFVDHRGSVDSDMKKQFHDLMVKLRDLGERRNELVHSRYNRWINIHGKEGLLRTNSRLRGSKGEREEKEEELQPAAFDGDLARLAVAAQELERFRLQFIDWKFPDVA